MGTPAFWLVALSFSIIALGNSAAGLFFIPHLDREGFSRSEAAWTLTATSIVGVGANFLSGWLSDTLDRRAIVMLAYVLQGAGLAVFAFASSAWHLVLVVALFGFGSRAIFPVISPLLADYFGTANFGKIQGVLFSAFTMGGVAGNQIAAAVEDASGSYTRAFVGYACASFLGIALMALVRRPPPASAHG
jgi:MFS family permease